LSPRAPNLDVSLQQSLEQLYRLDESPPVEHFRIDRDAFVQVLGRAAARQREALVVHHAGDETHLALFICDEVMAKARQLHASPDVRTLDAFCVAAEGVSHFVYFTYCGERQERPVSQMELELQAEVDKFILLNVLLAMDGEALVTALFDNATLSADLDDAERERYQLAHRLGRRYARWFSRAARGGRTEHALADARRLYRMPLTAKLDHIAKAA
jgi:hypothetical protein